MPPQSDITERPIRLDVPGVDPDSPGKTSLPGYHLPSGILDEIAALRNPERPDASKEKSPLSLFFIILLSVGLAGLLFFFLFNVEDPSMPRLPSLSGVDTPATRLIKHRQLPSPVTTGAFRPVVPRRGRVTPDYSAHLPALTAPQHQHINRVLQFTYAQVNPDTLLADSFSGDVRLRHWSVIYDNAMRAIMHMKTGDIAMAKKTIDYFMTNKAIRKTGWLMKGNRRVIRRGWIVNIVDSAQGRPGGRGIEHVAHSGPNAYLGIAAIHLFRATGERKYLAFARERWKLIKDLQNDNPSDPNFGGVRMGPMGNPENPREQRLDFKKNNPSYYQFYNGEHAADFKALCDLLYNLDEAHADEYLEASKLISIWDQKIFDKEKHLFWIGTTEVPYRDINLAKQIPAGIIPMHPLDTTALKVSVYGVDGLNHFEPNGAVKIRKAIDDNFKVKVQKTGEDGQVQTITGYDFVTHEDRRRLVLLIEEGPKEDIKVRRGMGRRPLVTDEWSTWVAFADLRLAQDYLDRGDETSAKIYTDHFKFNALGQGFIGAYSLGNGVRAYPYAHPLPYGLNKPVGFGWNTHHKPYAIIGGVARTLGAVRFDPFQMDGGAFVIKEKFDTARLAPRPRGGADSSGIITEAELYLEDAWDHVSLAKENGPDAEMEWNKALFSAERMLTEHADWSEVAEVQNQIARRSPDKYPLYGMDNVRIKDLEPLYRRYWALYHVGAAEYIRFIAYSELAKMARMKNDDVARIRAKVKSIESATNLIEKYSFAQAYDSRGWMWQPVNSLYEYLGFYEFTPKEYLAKLAKTNAPGTPASFPLSPVVDSIMNNY